MINKSSTAKLINKWNQYNTYHCDYLKCCSISIFCTAKLTKDYMVNISSIFYIQLKSLWTKSGNRIKHVNSNLFSREALQRRSNSLQIPTALFSLCSLVHSTGTQMESERERKEFLLFHSHTPYDYEETNVYLSCSLELVLYVQPTASWPLKGARYKRVKFQKYLLMPQVEQIHEWELGWLPLPDANSVPPPKTSPEGQRTPQKWDLASEGCST